MYLRIAYYKIKFGYSQVLFMGSVPRINHLLAIVSWDLSQPFPSEIYLLFWITLDVTKQYECLKKSTDITTRVKVFQLCIATTLFTRTC